MQPGQNKNLSANRVGCSRPVKFPPQRVVRSPISVNKPHLAAFHILPLVRSGRYALGNRETTVGQPACAVRRCA
ncbi:hypothetical protein EMPG_10497 [Blastomyces silverae]|uniref:Uncharacterized protein n=1 Tax=Blastomyces silverae TaxID=2060906 RepID=A0A0H1B4Q1_9EURO|nr:hypothetical protein EMPG_10497 [Blastomyces silverae]